MTTSAGVSLDPAVVRQVLADSLGYLYPAALRVAVRFGIADHLAGGPRSAEELGELSGASAGHLRRVLRLLATRGMFGEGPAGTFHLTPAAELLRGDSPVPLAPVVLMFTDELYWRPAGRLADTVGAGASVFPEVFGASFYDHLAADADRFRAFDAARSDLSDLERRPVLAALDLPERGVVVDVGGGRGGLLAAVLAARPGLTGVLVDRPEVLREHRLTDPAIAGRWSLVAGDFFESVPAGDVHLLKRILHDKDDDTAVRVLRTVRAAMTPSSRLLVVDAVVPPGDGPHPGVVSDVLMMSVWDGRERTAQEVAALLSAAGLRLTRVVPTASPVSVLEAVPA